MKYLKTYETYKEDYNKKFRMIHKLEREIADTSYNIIQEVTELFYTLSVEKNDLYYLEVTDEVIKYLYGDMDKKYIYIKHFERGIQDITTLRDEWLVELMDVMVKKFPDYFEGKNMGFFDLKTKE